MYGRSDDAIRYHGELLNLPLIEGVAVNEHNYDIVKSLWFGFMPQKKNINFDINFYDQSSITQIILFLYRKQVTKALKKHY